MIKYTQTEYNNFDDKKQIEILKCAFRELCEDIFKCQRIDIEDFTIEANTGKKGKGIAIAPIEKNSGAITIENIINWHFYKKSLPARRKKHHIGVYEYLVNNYIISKDMTIKEPLNQILYGPPGTGKTYNTIYKALDILEPKDNWESWSIDDSKEGRTNVLDKFKEYKENIQIVMTTFHQSMSYEDFVEGIKPNIKESEDESLGFRNKKGVFRDICELAEKEFVIDNMDNFDEAWSMLIEKLQVNISIEIEQPKNTFSIELNKTEKGLIAKPGNSSVYISKEQLYNIYLGRPGVAKGGNDGYRKAIVLYMTKNCGLRTYNQGRQNFDSIKKYVLIIDEINRGNVANIFGELITLIEDDKRTTKWDEGQCKYVENPEGIKVTLPYSGQEFGVPGNLYIIGTMNTADRSVEALDSALRRRFSFTEMMPKPKLLKDAKINGVHISNGTDQASLADLLYTINKRIEILKDREHQIGHSYFMKFVNKGNVDAEELREVFYNKIIPLLQEYFYGDYESILKVLSSKFIIKNEEKNTDNKNVDFFENIGNNDGIDKPTELPYTIKTVENGKFADAIISLKLVKYPIDKQETRSTLPATEQSNAQ